MINEHKVNNEHIFIEKTTALEAWKKVQGWNKQFAVVLVEACRIFPELHIPEEASLDAKIRKLVAGVHDEKTEVAKV